MAILQTCYCCSSLKQLSLVGGCFTLLLSSLYVFIYYGGESGAFTMVRAINTNGSALMDNRTTFSLSDNKIWNESSSTNPYDPGISPYVEDNRITRVVQGSIINPEGFDLKENSGFYFGKSICDILVILSCVILFVGLWQEIRCYLLPWIALSTLQAGFSIVDTFSKLSLDTTTFEPKTAFIFTLTFLLMFAQIYFILGCVSLFQENFRCANNNNINSVHGEALLGQSQIQKKPFIRVKNGQSSKAICVPMKVLRDGKTILAEDPYQLKDFKVIPTLLLQSPFPNEGSSRPLANDSEAGLRPPDATSFIINRRPNRSRSTKLEVIQEASMVGSQSGDDGVETQELETSEKTEKPLWISNLRNSAPVFDMGLNTQCTQPRIAIEIPDQQIHAQDDETLPSERNDHNLSSKESYLVSLQVEGIKTNYDTTNTTSLASPATASATTITTCASRGSTTINATSTTTVPVATTLFSTTSTPTPIIPTKTSIMLSSLPTDTCLSSVKIPTNPPNFWPSAKLVLKYIAGNTNASKEKDSSIESNLVASNCTKTVDPIIDDDFKDDIW